MARSKHASAKEVLPDILATDLITAGTSEDTGIIVVVKARNGPVVGSCTNTRVGLFRMVQLAGRPHFSCLAIKQELHLRVVSSIA